MDIQYPLEHFLPIERYGHSNNAKSVNSRENGTPFKGVETQVRLACSKRIPKDHVLVKIQAAALNPLGWNSDPSFYTHSAAYMAPDGVFVTTTPAPHRISLKEIGYLIKTLTAITWPAWLGGIPREFNSPLSKRTRLI